MMALGAQSGNSHRSGTGGQGEGAGRARELGKIWQTAPQTKIRQRSKPKTSGAFLCPSVCVRIVLGGELFLADAT